MESKRIHVLVPPSMLRDLDALAKKFAMDRSSAIRYCMARTFEEEGVVSVQDKKGTKKVKST